MLLLKMLSETLLSQREKTFPAQNMSITQVQFTLYLCGGEIFLLLLFPFPIFDL